MSQCKYCGQSIIWAKTAKGKLTPLDAEMVEGGEWIIVDGVAVKLSPVEMMLGQKAYRSHWASCPGAREHRKVKS